MSASSNLNMSVSFLVVSVLCLLLSTALSFQAGCAGDAKGGSLGNVELALHYDSLAMFLLLAGMSMGAVGLMVRSTPALSQRATQAVAWFFGSHRQFHHPSQARYGHSCWKLQRGCSAWHVNQCFKTSGT